MLSLRQLQLPACGRSLASVLMVLWITAVSAFSDPIPATHKQGSMHGFLLLKSDNGRVIAVGDQVNVVRGDKIHSRLVFRFRDGSIDDESTVFRQGSVFQLLRDHHIQKGPSFPEPSDVTVDVPAGEVSWRETKDGKNEMKVEHMDLPQDLVNGMVSMVVENFPEKATEFKTSYLVIASKPRVIKLSIKPDGTDSARVGGGSRRSNRFNVHIDIGGLSGVIAPVLGKQPPDVKLWVIDGEVPTFVKMEGELYQKGPRWTMILTSPTWPSGSSEKSK
jgi:hypothetical protein